MNMKNPFAKLRNVAPLAALLASLPMLPAEAAEGVRPPRPSRSSTNAPSSGPGFDNFKIIPERNIFNPNRRQRSDSRSERREDPVQFFSLVGAMQYEGKTVAFFDGSRSDFRKAFEKDSSIEGFKLVQISPKSVMLADKTNQFQLSVGMQMRRQGEEAWQMVSGNAAPTLSASNTNLVGSGQKSDSDTGKSGSSDDILKRLLQKREEELK